MTTPELPPLPPLGRFSQDFHRMRVMQDGAWCPYDDVKAIDDAREARERILLAYIASLEAINENNLAEAAARIAELEADSERLRLALAEEIAGRLDRELSPNRHQPPPVPPDKL